LSYGRYVLFINNLGESTKVAEWPRVKLGSSLPQGPFQETIVPFKHVQCLVARNFHNRQMVNARSPHIGHGRMPEIMKRKPLNICPPTGGIKGRFDGIDRVPFHQEHMVFTQVADFIQILEQGRQLRR